MNLGIGIPVLASNYLPEGVEIELQARLFLRFFVCSNPFIYVYIKCVCGRVLVSLCVYGCV